MSVEVIFRGVCLFRTSGNNLKDVWVPNGETRAKLRTHPDGKEAKKHYSRMLVFDASNNPAARVDLRETDVVISDEFGGTCNVLPSFKELPDFNKVRRHKKRAPLALIDRKSRDPLFGDVVTTTVQLEGGAIGSSGTQLQFWLPPLHPNVKVDKNKADRMSRRLAFQATWRSQSATATVVVRDREGNLWTQLVLDEARPKAYLYNFDTEWPTLAELAGTDEPAKQGTIFDQDFKWLFQLFREPRQGWKAWYGAGGAKQLPAPRADLGRDQPGVIARNPGSAGCFGAFI